MIDIPKITITNSLNRVDCVWPFLLNESIVCFEALRSFAFPFRGPENMIVVWEDAEVTRASISSSRLRFCYETPVRYAKNIYLKNLYLFHFHRVGQDLQFRNFKASKKLLNFGRFFSLRQNGCFPGLARWG